MYKVMRDRHGVVVRHKVPPCAASFGNRGAQTKGESTHMGIGLIPSHHPIHVHRGGGLIHGITISFGMTWIGRTESLPGGPVLPIVINN